jgi:signal transduction histidine kinase
LKCAGISATASIDYSIASLRGADGRITGNIAVLVDITEQTNGRELRLAMTIWKNGSRATDN